MNQKVENRKLIELDNGLKVLCINKTNFKTSSVRIKVFAGSLHEEVPGVAHFFEHICFQGTKDFPTQKKLNDFSDKNALYKNAYTNHTETVFTTDGPDLDSVVQVATQLAFYPLITSESLEKERRAVIDEARADQYAPGIKAKQRQWKLIGGEKYSRLITGTIEEINSVTYHQLTKFHKRHYRPSNTLIVICSDKPVEEQIKVLNIYIKDVKKQEHLEPVLLKLPWLKTSKKFSIVQNELDEQAQTQISLNYTIDSPKDYRSYLLEVTASNVLHYSAFRYLREELVLAYSANAGANYLENRNFGISEEFQSFSLYMNLDGSVAAQGIKELQLVPGIAIKDTKLIKNKIKNTRYSGALDEEANAMTTADSAVRSAQVFYDGEYAPSKFVKIVQSFKVEEVIEEIKKLTSNLKLIQVTTPSKAVIDELSKILK